MADHALLTIVNPNSALTNPTLFIDLTNMPASWLSAITASDGTKGRVYKGDGTTRLACHWIGFVDDETPGVLAVMWSGTLAASGTQQLWIEPPVTENDSVGVSETYGQYNAYDGTNTHTYITMDDSLSNANSSTAHTIHGTLNVGDSSGLLGKATGYDSEDDIEFSSAFDWTGDWSMSVLLNLNSGGADRNVFGDSVDSNSPRAWLDYDGSGMRPAWWSGASDQAYGTTYLSLSQWYYVACYT